MRKLKISSAENLDSLSENYEKQFKNQQKNILSSSEEENPNIKNLVTNTKNENSNQIKEQQFQTYNKQRNKNRQKKKKNQKNPQQKNFQVSPN